MNRIYRYECKRLISNKRFAGLGALILIYGWLVLKNVTIMGVLDPEFSLPAGAVLVRCVALALGLVLTTARLQNSDYDFLFHTIHKSRGNGYEQVY